MSISLEIGIGHFNNENISFKLVFKNIPQRIDFRLSIQNFLNEEVDLDFFIKEIIA